MNTGIKQNHEKQRFEVHINNSVGYMTYELNDGFIDYTHTIVPRELGGKGLGTDLVKYGLAYARVNHLQVKPTCSFVVAMIEKNKVYQDLLVED